MPHCSLRCIPFLPRPIAVTGVFHFLHRPFLSILSLFTVPYLSITAMAGIFTQVEKFSIHDGQSIDVVYTNDLTEVQRNLDMYERMLEGRDPEDRFMALDLEYTSEGPNHEFVQLVAVI